MDDGRPASDPPSVHPPAPKTSVLDRHHLSLRDGLWLLGAAGGGLIGYFTAQAGTQKAFQDEREARAAAISSATNPITTKLGGIENSLVELKAYHVGIEKRLELLETRVDKLGKTLEKNGAIWSADHIKRREAFCTTKCGQREAQCHADCRAQYNSCGVTCESNPSSPCFHDCVKAINSPGPTEQQKAAAEPESTP
jgi:hypothetical protein